MSHVGHSGTVKPLMLRHLVGYLEGVELDNLVSQSVSRFLRIAETPTQAGISAHRYPSFIMCLIINLFALFGVIFLGG